MILSQKITFLVAVCLLSAFLLVRREPDPGSHGHSLVSAPPTIYRLQNHKETEPSRELLAAWKEAWEAVGWIPMTLSIPEIVNLDQFKDIHERMASSQLSREQQDQIWKYVAMAAVGGGWIGHIDTFPLDSIMDEANFLPNDGRFTVFDESRASLVSGRADEWLWTARLLLRHATESKNTDSWSELLALRELQSPNGVLFVDKVRHLSENPTWDSSECPLTNDKRAVSFGTTQNKPEFASLVSDWFSRWRNECASKIHNRLGRAKPKVGVKKISMPHMYRFDNDIETTDENMKKIRFVWQRVWEAGEWVPLSLPINQFINSPEYHTIKADLDRSRLSPQQQRHVWKYVAMSAVGGGWVAHADTFPLHPSRRQGISLPNNGRITVYDDGFPCLVSGSADEFLRTAKRMARHARSYRGKEPWTEAMSLKAQGVVLQKDVLDMSQHLHYHGLEQSSWEWTTGDCDGVRNKRAVHFSLDDGSSISNETDIPDPAERVVQWLAKWLDSCDVSMHFVANVRRL